MSQPLFNFNYTESGQQPLQPVQQKAKAALSKEQAQFNRLTKRIQQLRSNLELNTAQLDYLSSLYHQILAPAITLEGRYMKNMALKLDAKLPQAGLSKSMRDDAEALIMQLTGDALDILGPDPELDELTQKYMQPDEGEAALMDGIMNVFLDQLHRETGLRVNPEHLKGGQINYEKLQEDLSAQAKEQEAKMKSRKKTPAQLKREQAEQQKEELKQKSLRSVYVSLAKILHPDTEQDDTLRAEKEECMKQVTAAYEAKDLMQLLRLEMTWVQRHEQSLQNSNAAMLKVYIDLMKDQVKDLELENHMLLSGPRYRHVTDYMRLPRQRAKKYMEDELKDYEHDALIYTDLLQKLDTEKNLRKVIEHCLRLLSEDDFDDAMDDFDEIMGMMMNPFPPKGKKGKNNPGW